MHWCLYKNAVPLQSPSFLPCMTAQLHPSKKSPVKSLARSSASCAESPPTFSRCQIVVPLGGKDAPRLCSETLPGAGPITGAGVPRPKYFPQGLARGFREELDVCPPCTGSLCPWRLLCRSTGHWGKWNEFETQCSFSDKVSSLHFLL